jgi:hypothetical protein
MAIGSCYIWECPKFEENTGHMKAVGNLKKLKVFSELLRAGCWLHSWGFL